MTDDKICRHSTWTQQCPYCCDVNLLDASSGVIKAVKQSAINEASKADYRKRIKEQQATIDLLVVGLKEIAKGQCPADYGKPIVTIDRLQNIAIGTLEDK